MKKILSFLALGLLLAVSCEKEGPTTVNEITDLYTAPADAKVMTLTGGESTWATDRRYFDLKFSDITTTLVGYDALLAPGQYVVGADQIGNAINTKVNGQNASDGYFTVGERNGQYQITAHFNGQVYYWTGTLPFNPDPDPTMLTEVLSAQSNKQNGQNSLTMNLATPGIHQEFDMTTYQQVWVGEGNYLALDIYSDDGYLHDGTYKACAEGGVINPGEFGRGWDPGDIYGIGYEFKDWGTCLWTVANGAATAEKITDGIVNVTSREEKVDGKDVTIWTISWGVEHPVDIVFEGAIPALTKPKKPDGPVQLDYTYVIGEPAQCSTSAGEIVSGVMKYPFIISDKGGNEVAYLELVLNEGQTAEIEGEYVSTEYAHEAGQLANGYYLDYSAWGYGIIAGGSYYVGADGEKVYIDPGVTLFVTKVATGAFRFTSDGFDYAAAGPDYVPGGGGEGGDDDVTGDVVLKLTSGLTYTMEDVTSSNQADASGTPLSGMTLWRVTVSDGSGTVAAFDLGTAEGSSDLAGEYTVMSYPNAVGKAGNGWGFAAWGMFGGCYFLSDGAYYFIPADATITVSNNADGTLKIKFQGAIQKDDYSDGGQGGLLLNNIAKG